MKILVNYDLLKEIQRAKEPFTIVKEMKNSPSVCITMWAAGTGVGLVYNAPLLEFSLYSLSVAFVTNAFLTGAAYMLVGDYYKKGAFRNLNQLATNFRNLGVDTTYDLLLESENYQKNYRVKLNENCLPCLLENKYILVPSYNNLGEIQNTSILQEHVLGTKDYVLSVDSPSKEHRFVYAKG